MAHILNVKYRYGDVTEHFTDSDGQEQERTTPGQLVHEVTFMADRHTPQTLTFHEAGTDVSGDGEEAPRVVGQGAMLVHEYTDPQDAVRDYLDGVI